MRLFAFFICFFAKTIFSMVITDALHLDCQAELEKRMGTALALRTLEHMREIGELIEYSESGNYDNIKRYGYLDYLKPTDDLKMELLNIQYDINNNLIEPSLEKINNLRLADCGEQSVLLASKLIKDEELVDIFQIYFVHIAADLGNCSNCHRLIALYPKELQPLKMKTSYLSIFSWDKYPIFLDPWSQKIFIAGFNLKRWENYGHPAGYFGYAFQSGDSFIHFWPIDRDLKIISLDT